MCGPWLVALPSLCSSSGYVPPRAFNAIIPRIVWHTRVCLSSCGVYLVPFDVRPVLHPHQEVALVSVAAIRPWILFALSVRATVVAFWCVWFA
jgi:hypothetical protein